MGYVKKNITANTYLNIFCDKVSAQYSLCTYTRILFKEHMRNNNSKVQGDV